MIGLRLLLVAAIAIYPVSSFASPKKYYVDPSQFTATFQVEAKDNKSVSGVFTTAMGSFSYDAEAKTLSNLKIAVDANALSVSSKTLAHDLKLLFEPSTYPEIALTSTASTELKDGKGEIKATMKLRGQSKPMNCEADKTSDTGLALKCSFKRADFGMSDRPDYPTDFGEAMTFMFDMQGVQQ